MSKDILTRSDNSEIFEYDYPDFPIYAHKEYVSSYPRFRCAAHWHEDLEFHLVLEGTMTCDVNEETVMIAPGNGIWINSRQLHCNYSPNQTECVYLCVLLHPSLLAATDAIALDYVLEYLNHPGLPLCLLDRSVPWQKKVLDQIGRIYELRSGGHSPLRIQGTFLDMWATMTENIPIPEHISKKDLEKSNALKQMLHYIYLHYEEPVTLAQIAEAGNVGKSTCTEVFKSHLHETPIRYLIQYRLEKAAELLSCTDKSITDISYNVGFSNPSYFTSTFRTFYHCSPSQYRRNNPQYAKISDYASAAEVSESAVNLA